jgi:D-arginine dehydrogenase
MITSADILVIGAGIGGASVAAHLAARRSVIVLEMEDRPGYHATGRSAAQYDQNYGPPLVQALSRASKSWFDAPPDGFAQSPILSPRPTLFIVPRGQEAAETKFLHAQDAESLPLKYAATLVPILHCGALIASYFDRSTADIDVDVLHQGYLRTLRQRSGKIVTNAEVVELVRQESTWHCRTRAGDFAAGTIVNASGAWGDVVAGRVGARPLGLVPKRRSAALLPNPNGHDSRNWPLTCDVAETFYFKPTGGALLISPADATPVEPHDAFADDMAIAEGIERMQACTNVEVTHLQHSWAGLRTFAPDGNPVVGEEPDFPGFWWLVGQGGYGIQTAPALSLIAASLIETGLVPQPFSAFGITADALSPHRLR